MSSGGRAGLPFSTGHGAGAVVSLPGRPPTDQATVRQCCAGQPVAGGRPSISVLHAQFPDRGRDDCCGKGH